MTTSDVEVAEILKTRNGITLVRTTTGSYAVGLLYQVGEPLTNHVHGVDFGRSDSFEAMLSLWERKSQ